MYSSLASFLRFPHPLSLLLTLQECPASFCSYKLLILYNMNLLYIKPRNCTPSTLLVRVTVISSVLRHLIHIPCSVFISFVYADLLYNHVCVGVYMYMRVHIYHGSHSTALLAFEKGQIIELIHSANLIGPLTSGQSVCLYFLKVRVTDSHHDSPLFTLGPMIWTCPFALVVRTLTIELSF